MPVDLVDGCSRRNVVMIYVKTFCLFTNEIGACRRGVHYLALSRRRIVCTIVCSLGKQELVEDVIGNLHDRGEYLEYRVERIRVAVGRPDLSSL